MDVTNRYVLDFAARHGGRILDYGCGSGAVVLAGRSAGLDIWGTDLYYAGAETRPPDSAFIRPMDASRIPFPDESFDVVTNNQVMEHVEDLELVLSEISRVLRPGGTVLSIFPSADVWREGHIGIPFSHRLPRDSALRFYYTWALRALGLGTWKEQAPTTRAWAADKLEWIDKWTRYRSRREILTAYGRFFTNELCETGYIEYRLRDVPSATRAAVAGALRWAPVGAAAAAVFRKLAFLVIVSRKAPTGTSGPVAT